MADEQKTADETPAGRIAKAIEGRPAAGYAEVLADDVLAVAALVPVANSTPVLRALAKGARNAPVRTNDDGDRVPCPVHQEAGKLRQLLEAAGVHTE